jgi:menaquinol-cytochrome c reductase iron-sulfur subunit
MPEGKPNDAPDARSEPTAPNPGAHHDPPRRGALRSLVTLGTVAYAGALAAPAAAFLAGAAGGSGGGQRWLRVAALADLPNGQPHRVKVVGNERDAFTVTRDELLGSVWLIREGDRVRALSATCPHLGCAVDLSADRKSFGCPCHTSRFGLSGDAEAGPSPRGMDPLTVRIRDGVVEIDFRRYRQGITERKELGA